MLNDQVILLVEDNPDDEALTLRALKKNNIENKVVVARDGVEAIDYLFGTGTYAGRDPCDLPQIVLLDLKLPKMNGFEVLTKLRGNPRTKLLPVIILTSSKEQKDLTLGYGLGALLLLSIGIIRWIPLVFPIWVLLISVAILFENPISRKYAER